MVFVGFKGATAYELQVWRIWLRITHLRGAYWRWKPWRRIDVGFAAPEDY